MHYWNSYYLRQRQSNTRAFLTPTYGLPENQIFKDQQKKLFGGLHLLCEIDRRPYLCLGTSC